jgi:hypothetical protein
LEVNSGSNFTTMDMALYKDWNSESICSNQSDNK